MITKCLLVLCLKIVTILPFLSEGCSEEQGGKGCPICRMSGSSERRCARAVGHCHLCHCRSPGCQVKEVWKSQHSLYVPHMLCSSPPEFAGLLEEPFCSVFLPSEAVQEVNSFSHAPQGHAALQSVNKQFSFSVTLYAAQRDVNLNKYQ